MTIDFSQNLWDVFLRMLESGCCTVGTNVSSKKISNTSKSYKNLEKIKRVEGGEKIDFV